MADALTTTANVGAGVNTYYDKRFLRMLTQQLRLIPFGQRRPLPEGNGTTIEFFRWLALAKVKPTTAANSGGRLLTEGTTPDSIGATGQKISKTLAEYGAHFKPTSLVKQAHIDVGLTGLVDIMALDGATSLDTLCWMELCSNGCFALPADESATSQYDSVLGTVTSTTVLSGGAVLEAVTAYGGTDDDLNQSVITILSGPAKGQSRMITDYDADGAATGTAISGRMTVSPAFDMLPEAGDSYHIAAPDELTTGDNLSYSNIKKARTLLKTYDARPFGGGFFVGIVDPDQASALMDDTQWKNIMTYKDQTMGLFDGEIGKFAGVRFIENSNSFNFPFSATREQANNTHGPGISGANWTTTTGATYATVVPIFGREAFGVTTFARKGGQARKPSVIIKNPGSQDTSNPMDMYSTVAWKVEACYKGLQALHVIAIWCQS